MGIGKILKVTALAACLSLPLHAQGIGEAQNGGIRVAGGAINLMGYAQTTYDVTSVGESDNKKVTNGFDVQRFIMMADAKLSDKLGFWLMYDFAASKFHEYYAQYSFSPALKLRVGQFKQPFTLESLMPPFLVSNIGFDESILYMAGIGGDPCFGMGRVGRDSGIMLTGDLIDHGAGKLLGYSIGIFNGSGMNLKDNNNQKDVIGMLNVRPVTGLTISTSFILGTARAQAPSPYGAFAAGENYRRNRFSAGVEYKGSPVYVRSEFMSGWDGGVNSIGAYIDIEGRVAKNLDIVAGYDFLDRNTGLKTDAPSHPASTNNFMVGLQYWVYKQCGIRSEYIHKSPRMGVPVNQWITQFQIAF